MSNTLEEHLETLRQRFRAVVGTRSLTRLYYTTSVGVAPPTLQNFLLARHITTTSLRSIEAWVEQEEQAHA